MGFTEEESCVTIGSICIITGDPHNFGKSGEVYAIVMDDGEWYAQIYAQDAVKKFLLIDESGTHQFVNEIAYPLNQLLPIGNI